MAIHSKIEVERLLQRLQERHEALVQIMRGRETTKRDSFGDDVPSLGVRAEDIRFAVDDVSTALKEIKSRLGKG